MRYLTRWIILWEEYVLMILYLGNYEQYWLTEATSLIKNGHKIICEYEKECEY